jgi:HIRAN domain
MEQKDGLIKVSTGLLSALSKGLISIDVMPREILVLECLVAGTSFRKLETIEPELKSEVKLTCKREAKNEYDQHAISLWFNENKIGFIPRDRNEVIARLMDAGKSFFATIQAKEWEGNWLRLDIKIYLKD